MNILHGVLVRGCFVKSACVRSWFFHVLARAKHRTPQSVVGTARAWLLGLVRASLRRFFRAVPCDADPAWDRRCETASSAARGRPGRQRFCVTMHGGRPLPPPPWGRACFNVMAISRRTTPPRVFTEIRLPLPSCYYAASTLPWPFTKSCRLVETGTCTGLLVACGISCCRVRLK